MRDVEPRNDRDLIFASIVLSTALILGALCCVGGFLWVVLS